MSQVPNILIGLLAKDEALPQSHSENLVKEELSNVVVKTESHGDLECGVCGTKSEDCRHTVGLVTRMGTSLEKCYRRYAQRPFPRLICKRCLDLLQTLEATDLEFRRLQEEFNAILSCSPLATQIKTEPNDVHAYFHDELAGNDSDDEPLAFTKKKRKVDKRKKKPSVSKRNHKKTDESWECNICGVQGSEGGLLAESTHKLTTHDIAEANPITNIKKEGEDGSESQQYSNGFDSIFKMEDDDEDGFNDADSNYFPEEVSKSDSKNSKRKKLGTRAKKGTKKSKTVYPCDECSAKYTSEVRLTRHKSMKHECGKPPYICEICGAHYKHKRACDIHIAMHKGISDWKCEECNKLFPSKGALARHNNIHTGKLNYQCDLCGKSFIHTSSFKMHKLSHSGVKPHSCAVCGLALLTRSHLQRHMRVHSGEKKHECGVCGKRFSERHLQRHMRVHSGEKKHECGVCGKRFSERYNLLAHTKMHDTPAAASAANREVARKVFRCYFCVERFERRYMLERHMGAAHGRALERPPPTPRNTMSKMLKLQANKTVGVNADEKTERSPDNKIVPTDNPPASTGTPWEYSARPHFSH